MSAIIFLCLVCFAIGGAFGWQVGLYQGDGRTNSRWVKRSEAEHQAAKSRKTGG